MAERISILIASDANYAPYYGIMLTSLFKQNRDSRFDVYFLTDRSLSTDNAHKFDKLTANYGARLFVLPVDIDLVKGFPEVLHIKLPAYYHLSLSNLLPETIHKILYLDGDIIINGNIRPLWEVNLTNYASAQVKDNAFLDEQNYQRLKYNKKWGYYNNGVAIYNLDYLREIDFSNVAIRYIHENKDKVYWMDQDAENALLHEKMLSLPITYNFQTLFMSNLHWNTYSIDFQNEILNVAEKPVIVHYCGPLKPWQYQYYKMPYAALWNSVRKKSFWRDSVIRKPHVKFLKHTLKRIFRYSDLLEIRDKEYIRESLHFA